MEDKFLTKAIKKVLKRFSEGDLSVEDAQLVAVNVAKGIKLQPDQCDLLSTLIKVLTEHEKRIAGMDNSSLYAPAGLKIATKGL